MSAPLIILASASPRRQELFTRLGLPFEVVPARMEPAADPLAPPEDAVLAVARAKAREVAARYPDRVVVGADTVVCAGGRLLGKPRDAAEAAAMLGQLQGAWHRVLTAVWVCAPGREDGFTDQTAVQFYPMDKAAIAAYIATGEPMDKAGAYGIQGVGMRYIRGIIGDYYTVMGLPAARLMRFLPPFFSGT